MALANTPGEPDIGFLNTVHLSQAVFRRVQSPSGGVRIERLAEPDLNLSDIEIESSLPNGSDAWARAKRRPDEALIRALARAHRWKRMLEAGKCRSIAEIAEAEKIGRSFGGRLLNLTLLAPDIQEAILDGRQPKGMQLEELTVVMPGAWEEQRHHILC